MALFKKKTIADDAKDFENQYKIAKILIFNYLEIWFKQIFATPDFKEAFADKPTIHTAMAAEVMSLLLVLNNTEKVENNDESVLAKKHAEKWASDVLSQDRDFCELIIQTLRMDVVFNQFVNGTKWLLEDQRGKKISEVLTKFGGKVTETPNPKKYDKLLKKWMARNEITKNETLGLLSNQTIGGQSVLSRLFKEALKEDAKEISKIELTYFALSTTGYFYLRLNNSENKEDIFDEVSLNVLQKSLPYSSKVISIEEAIREFQKRYSEYDELIQLVFKKDNIDSHACTTLLMHIYACVMGKSEREKMIEITLASPLIGQYLVDHVDFIKKMK